MIVKDGKPFYDVDVTNAEGQTVGVQLLSSTEVRASNKDELMAYMKRKLLRDPYTNHFPSEERVGVNAEPYWLV